MATTAPSAAKRQAIARPMPDAAPVTRTRFPASRRAAASVIAMAGRSCRLDDLRRARGSGIEQLARQLVADNRLGEPSAVDQPVEIDLGIDAELAAEEDDLLAADIASRRLVAGEGAAAETAETGIEMIDPFEQPGIDIGDAEAARIVQMKADAQLRPARPHGADDTTD